MPTPPAYYFVTAKKNATGEGLELPFQQPQSLSTKDVANWDGTILDLRDQAGFAACHIPGSLNTVTDEHFSLLIGFAIDPHSDIALVGSSSSVSTAAMRLYRMGYDHVKGYLAGGIDAWRKEARQTTSFTYLTPQEAEQNMKSGQALLVDIRTESEQAGELIAQAKSIPLAKLKDQQKELPKDKQIIFLCGHGCRGSLASAMLKIAGFTNIANLAGGMVGWKAAGLSTETGSPSEVEEAA
jgi:rhodanese-related sulfurtransferase